MISARMAAQPAAAYLMAQTVVAQGAALASAQRRIEALEAGSGDFLSGLFGDAPVRRAHASAHEGSSGFLAGAARTAMGVATGVLVAEALAQAFVGDADLLGFADEGDGDAFDAGF